MSGSNWLGGLFNERDVAAVDPALTLQLNRWLELIKSGKLRVEDFAAMIAKRAGDRAPHLQTPEGIEAFCREVMKICNSMRD